MTKNTRLICRILDRVCKGWERYEIEMQLDKVRGGECHIRVFGGFTQITFVQVCVNPKFKQRKLKRTPTIGELQEMAVNTVIDFGELGLFLLSQVKIRAPRP